jgi:hypothetical protein
VPSSGVTYAVTLDYALAAQWWHTSPGEFAKLEPGEQAYMVAVFRSKRMIDSVLELEQAKKLQKKNKGAK